MKKLIFTLAFIFIAVSAFGQTMYNGPQFTVGWDASAKPTCATTGTPTAVCPTPGGPAVGTITYQVWATNNLVDTVGVKIGGEITATQLLISFTKGTTYYISIDSRFNGTGGAAQTVSAGRAWSHKAADCLNGNTFGFLYKDPDIPPPVPGKPAGVHMLSLLKALKDIPS